MIIKYNRLITGLFLIFSGVIIILLPWHLILNAIKIVACFIILFTSVPLLIEYIKHVGRYHTYRYPMVDNVLMIVIAIVLLFMPVGTITKGIGIAVLGLAVINLLKANDKTEQFKKDSYRFVFGIILIVVDPGDITELVTWILGLMLIATGIILLMNIHIKGLKNKDEDIIDISNFHVNDH